MGKAAALEFRNVTKRYGAITAVNDVSFTVDAGTLVTLLGPSGCGKTTTLRLIAGLEIASEGSIIIGDREVTQLSAADRDVSMVFQSYALFPHMTVLENVAYGPSMSGLTKKQTQEMARGKLAQVGLDGFEARYPAELSGGQQQRVAVARALVLEPQVLLFDEPLSNLDAKLRRRVREEIRELQQEHGLTVVYVTHDQQEALAVSDRVIVMSDARIAQQGSPSDLYERPASRFMADFIGDANLVDGEIVDLDSGAIRFHAADVTVFLPLAEAMKDIAALGPATVALRPEALRIGDGVAPIGSLAGQLTKASYLGTHMEYEAKTPWGDIFVVTSETGHRLLPGQPVWITAGERGVVLVPDHPG